MDYRKPPLPESFKGPRIRGVCRWCAGPILEANGLPSKRRLWHKECLLIYLIASDPIEARKAVWKRDKGICYVCKNFCLPSIPPKRYQGRSLGKYWNVDHKMPLHLNIEHSIEFFLLSNMATICTKCHKEKNAREASDRVSHRNSLL